MSAIITRKALIAKATAQREGTTCGTYDHVTISTAFGSAHLLASTRGECIWCGTGREWR